MANQPKRYKKFVATAATATLVASAIVPAASAASYKDVADNNDHKKNIEAISELGYMGAGDNFRPYESLKRSQVAIILANWAQDVAGLEVPADYKTVQYFKDLPLTADDKLLQSAALVKKYGIFEGSNGNLNGNDAISRQHMALVLNKAYKAVHGTSLEELAGDTSDVVFADESSINKDYLPVVKALKKLGITAPASFNPNGNVTRGQFATFFMQTVNAEAPVNELKVKSVSAINAKQLEIKFTKPVSKDSVIEDPGSNETLEDGVFVIQRIPAGSGSTANNNIVADDAIGSLSEDGKTLTITADGSTFFKGQYTLSIVNNEIVSKDGLERVDGYTTTFTGDDKTAPTVKEVKYKAATNEISVVMSEPVEVYPAIRPNGSSTPVSVSANTTNTEFTFTAEDTWSGTNVELAISGAVDFAGNSLVSTKNTVKVTKEEGPVLVESIKQEGSNVIRVKFNRAIAGANAGAAETLVSNAVDVLNGTTAVSVDSVTRVSDDKTNTTFDIALDNTAAPDYDNIYFDKTSATLTVFFAEGTLEDVFGNNNEDDISKSVSMKIDKAAPTISSHSISSDSKEIRIKFNEKLTQLTAEEPGDFGVEVRRNGAPIASADLEINITSDNSDVLVISKADSSKFANGDYQVRFTKGTDNTDTVADAHGNLIDAQTYQGIKVSSNTTNVEVNTIATSGTNQFTVQFTGKVSDSALNPSSYTLDGVTLPSNTDIYFTNGNNRDEVVITLPSGTVNKGAVGGSTDNATLRVVAVKDSNNVSVPSFGSTDNVTVEDNTKATLKTARLIGDTIILTFDENLDNTLTFSDLTDVLAEFEIKRGTVALNEDVTGDGDDTAVATSVDGKTLTITITDPTDSNWSTIRAVGGTITVKTVASPTATDANGLEIKEKVQLTFTRN